MSPTQQTQKSILFHQVTSRRALLQAWLNVKPRVIHSKNPTVRAAAQKFAHDVDRSIRELQRELRSGTFRFAPQHGLLKTNKSGPNRGRKPPRPIVVAPVRSRVVQRAILDTCQTDQPKLARRLGSLPAVIATTTSVGGLPGRGVPEAIALIQDAITTGARWFVRSDLKKFFQTIPKPRIEAFLRSNIREVRFVDLFMEALSTELDNEDEVRELIHLFPIGDIGVPQGSALSALSANIVLAKFDALLNGRGIRTVRYLDDFVILGANKKSTLKAWSHAQQLLRLLGMECHDPNAGTGKAAMGEISDGFEFLSFRIDQQNVYPSPSVCADFLNELRTTIKMAKEAIIAAEDAPRRAEPRFIQTLSLIDRKIRGWGDAFSPTTLRLVLAQLDGQIDNIISGYESWFAHVRRGRTKKQQRRLMGVALLIDSNEKRSEISPATPGAQ